MTSGSDRGLIVIRQSIGEQCYRNAPLHRTIVFLNTMHEIGLRRIISGTLWIQGHYSEQGMVARQMANSLHLKSISEYKLRRHQKAATLSMQPVRRVQAWNRLAV